MLKRFLRYIALRARCNELQSLLSTDLNVVREVTIKE